MEINATDAHGNAETVEFVKLDKLGVENVILKETGAIVADMSHIGIDGIIGTSFLAYFKVTIDYGKQTVTFDSDTSKSPPRSGEHRISFELTKEDGYTPITTCLVGDRAIKAHIDTGAGDILIPISAMRETKAYQNRDFSKCRGICSRSVFETEEFEHITMQIDSIRVGNLNLEAVAVTSRPEKLSNVVLGKTFLSRFIVEMNYDELEMILLPRKVGALPEPETTFGLAWEQKNGDLLVSGIWSESSAEEQGVQVGDKILRIDGQPVADSSPIELYQLLEAHEQTTVELTNEAGTRTVTLEKRPSVKPKTGT
ncbi:MAG: retroviral-like aspartic protease family protein [Myxococcota bacterium]|nr:retroviral-like aspartic protease family protein [Myxococcota bacterium]